MKLFIKAIYIYITKVETRRGIRADLEYLLENAEGR